MFKTSANILNQSSDNILLKLIDISELIISSIPLHKCILCIDSIDINDIIIYQQLPIAGFFSKYKLSEDVRNILIQQKNKIVISEIGNYDFLSIGDIVRINQDKTIIRLYKRGSNSNLLFLTERCNSKCIMCSQPPKNKDDKYLLDDAFELIQLIDKNEKSLGISGGEPTLYGMDLVVLINKCYELLPNTILHILSNGRLLNNKLWLSYLKNIKHQKLIWGIPVFSSIPQIHDEITGIPYSHNETINGLYNLAIAKQRIELRVILLKPVIDNLKELGYFISRSLPFVSIISFMGIEPIGLAKENYKKIWIDPADYLDALVDTIYFLENNKIDCSIFNLPLCVIPYRLRRFSVKSISDWKVMYLSECHECGLFEQCGGFFFSHNDKWKSKLIQRVENNEIQ